MTDKAITTDNAKVKMGRLMEVIDKDTRKDEDEVIDYTDRIKYVVWVEDSDGKNERPLMLTAEQIKAAEKLAAENPEDIPQRSLLTDIMD